MFWGSNSKTCCMMGGGSTEDVNECENKMPDIKKIDNNDDTITEIKDDTKIDNKDDTKDNTKTDSKNCGDTPSVGSCLLKDNIIINVKENYKPVPVFQNKRKCYKIKDKDDKIKDDKIKDDKITISLLPIPFFN